MKVTIAAGRKEQPRKIRTVRKCFAGLWAYR